MKNIFIITISFLFSNICIAQNSDVLLGTWQKQTNNQIFRIELEKETGQYEDGTPRSIILGNFQIIELDANGNESIILNSDQIVNPNTPNSFQLPHAIRGGVYNSDFDTYFFMFTDINGIDGDLHLKLINSGNNNTIAQLEWSINTGWFRDGELNVPETATLTRVQ